jgi:tyrosyl-tRNA synthetase
MLSAKEQLDVIKRGIVDLYQEDELLKKLEKSIETNTPLKVKAGFDPTSPDLHLGHTVIFNKMKQLQDLGHDIYFLIGDFTAAIGDPTGRNETRPPLTQEQISENTKTYTEQAFKILDREKTKIVFNSEWMGKLTSYELIQLASKYPVARMLERDDFKKRFREGRSIAIHEFLYPLVQAYDSVMIEADIELGGTDQLFNLLLGRTLQKEFKKRRQIAITMPILEGLDAKNIDGVLTGKKMSKSLNNYVGITDAPNEMFGKLLSITDELMWKYYQLLSSKSTQEINDLKLDCEKGLNPKTVKVLFAKEMVERFYSEEDANNAENHFEQLFKKKDLPDEIEIFEIEIDEDKIWLPKLITQIGFSKSNGEATRLIKQNSVSVDSEKIIDTKLEFAKGSQFVLKVGKRRIGKIIIK